MLSTIETRKQTAKVSELLQTLYKDTIYIYILYRYIYNICIYTYHKVYACLKMRKMAVVYFLYVSVYLTVFELDKTPGIYIFNLSSIKCLNAHHTHTRSSLFSSISYYCFITSNTSCFIRLLSFSFYLFLFFYFFLK